MKNDNSTPDSDADQDAGPTGGFQGVRVTDLIEKQGTLPFIGLTSQCPTSGYPGAGSQLGARFANDPGAAPTYKEVIRVLPNAGEGVIWGTNEFVKPDGRGGVDVDIDAIRQVDGLDPAAIEAQTGASLDQLVDEANPDPLIEADRRKDIVDRRRLALNALGFDCRFRWQIASDRYDAGDMQKFLARKIAACQKAGYDDAFGWVRFRDWGGVVHITTIYNDLEYTLSPDLMDDLDIDGDAITLAGEDVEDAYDNGRCGAGHTIYYGERTSYDYRGGQRVEAKPVYYAPEIGAMFPLEHPRFTRKHIGDIMDARRERANDRVPLIEWYERILQKLGTLATQINTAIVRSRLIGLNFEELPFTVAEFYTLLGIPTGYAEEAASKVADFAAPEHIPSVWNLQLNLKLALLSEYDGSRASDRFTGFQELAGQIMRRPAQQIQLAFEEYALQQQDADQPDHMIPEDQQTLAESVEDIAELPGVTTEGELDVANAQALEDQVQHQLGNISAPQSP
jgi:hypothetical protein